MIQQFQEEDGLVDEAEYAVQKKLLKDKLESLVIPEFDFTVEAGELIENIGLLSNRATLEEKNELLRTMTEAVYVDLWANKSVVDTAEARLLPRAQVAPAEWQGDNLRPQRGCEADSH